MRGSLEVIVGSMLSGKSEMLIDRMVRAKISRRPTILFKHQIDSRFATLEVVSHSHVRHEATPITTKKDFLDRLGDEEVIGIDEIQFFTPDFVPLLDHLATQGRRVIVAGLDMDFLGQPFRTTQELTSRADSVDKLRAVCNVCHVEAAIRSQLMRDGKPVTRASSSILVGGQESYRVCCRGCFVMEGK